VRRRELERLGFTIVRETPDELVAMHARFQLRMPLLGVPHSVIVRRVTRLTLARLEADLEALRASPLASHTTVPVYLADVVDEDARLFVASGRAVTRGWFERAGLFPVVRDAATGTGTFLTRTPLLSPGLLTLSMARYLAARVLEPWLEPPTIRGRLTKGQAKLLLVVMTVLCVALIAALTRLAT
jgi:hypothetical protein